MAEGRKKSERKSYCEKKCRKVRMDVKKGEKWGKSAKRRDGEIEVRKGEEVGERKAKLRKKGRAYRK